MKYLSFKHEKDLPGIVAGIDEAGRGPWAGPVVAAAVIFKTRKVIKGIHDSKKLSKDARESLYSVIISQCIVGVGVCGVEDIDKHNILGATMLAMQRAHDALNHKPDIALVDGNRLPKLPCEMKAIIGGDALSISIAAASIIAKVTRDRIMEELAKEHPEYGWEHNSGYGTEKHQLALAKHGVTPHHRRSFAPIRKLLEAA
jgi:ribonuclease HII